MSIILLVVYITLEKQWFHNDGHPHNILLMYDDMHASRLKAEREIHIRNAGLGVVTVPISDP